MSQLLKTRDAISRWISREYAYGPARGLPATRVGTVTPAFYDEATKDACVVISIMDDWKRSFAFEP